MARVEATFLDGSDRRVVTLDQAVEMSSDRSIRHISGALGCAGPLAAYLASIRTNRPIVYVVADASTARRAADDLAHLAAGLPNTTRLPGSPDLPAPNVLLWPEENRYANVHPDRGLALERAAALAWLASDRPWRWLVASAATLVRRVPPPAVMREATLNFELGSILDVESLANHLARAGYLRVPVVEDRGSFAVRGGLVDIWPGGTPQPLRAELFGDTIVTLRAFDPETQRSGASLQRAWLPPSREVVLSDSVQQRASSVVRSLCDAVNMPSTRSRRLAQEVSLATAFFGSDAFLPAYYELVSITRYLTDEALLIVENPGSVVKALREDLDKAVAAAQRVAAEPHFSVEQLYVDEPTVNAALSGYSVLCLHPSAVGAPPGSSASSPLETAPVDMPTLAMRDHSKLMSSARLAHTTAGSHGALDPVVEQIHDWQEAGLEVVLTARTTTQADRLTTLLEHRQFSICRDGASRATPGGSPALRLGIGPLARGVVAPTLGLVLLTEEEIFGRRSHRAASRKRSLRKDLESLRTLAVGDYVVHAEHGIGRYEGLERKIIHGVAVELLAISYADSNRLLVPVHRLDIVEKYSGAEGHPRLDRLGTHSFAKTKARVRRKVRQMADELLQLYAERAAFSRPSLPPRDDELAAFEAAFPFEETADQAAAIADVMTDLERDNIMDRVVCGDVGFGKTEVAIRAAFRCAMAGRQVALLCPTTVLTQQHLMTFAARLESYPLVVRALSRFVSEREQKQTLRGLKHGSVDIVVGTHRLLSKDVHFKHLGLLVVDEEQRFGVAHKERIKQLRSTVDVLTLTATPIPRTLQMAVGGLREMSVIGTPPADRRSIRTITSCFDEDLIVEAVHRELSRGGQVYYVCPRIEGLEERAHHLQQLLPEARVVVAHGRMPEARLERRMLAFVLGDHDVLVSTSIVENGLDIPRANTIVIERADHFGLAQLYQLRGRVGRSSERAYCYLLVPPPSQMTEEARSRVAALERYTDLGSGVHIAALDMELRGAGDLLGAEQSGFVASVGFDLFCQMLEEAKSELQGAEPVAEIDPDLSLDVEALLPDDYVAEVGTRLGLYKRLAAARDEAEVTEIGAEIEDRFGPPPKVTVTLLQLMRLKTELRRLRVLGCESNRTAATLHLRSDTPLQAPDVAELVADSQGKYRLTPEGQLIRTAGEEERFLDGLEHATRMVSEVCRLAARHGKDGHCPG